LRWSKVYTQNGSKAGKRSPYLYVRCNTCNANKNSSNLSVDAISGIEITTAGDTWRLCFDENRNVAAKALPNNVGGSDKIDFNMLLGYSFVYRTNTAGDVLPSPAPWPTSNSSWGANTLFATIDVNIDPTLAPNFPNQDGELNLTGTPSYISTSKTVDVFFDALGTQNPSAANPKPKNWFYYWTQTAANCGKLRNYELHPCTSSTLFSFPL